jgi:ribosomal protein S3
MKISTIPDLPDSAIKLSTKVDFKHILTKTLLRARKKLRRSRLKKRILKHRAYIWDQRLAFETGHISFFDRNSLLSLFLGSSSLGLHYINGVALVKYGRASHIQNLPIEKRIGKKSPSAFIKHLDRERVRRYKYSAVQIRNIIRAAYIGFYLKNPTLVAQLLAYALPKLQRNRKETKFLRFMRKLAKVISASRWEILGIKLEFQGRVNRWRRTKCMQASYGLIPGVTFSSRIEYGSSQSITRKGAISVRLWIVYKSIFKNDLQTALNDYAQYSIRAQNTNLLDK